MGKSLHHRIFDNNANRIHIILPRDIGISYTIPIQRTPKMVQQLDILGDTE